MKKLLTVCFAVLLCLSLLACSKAAVPVSEPGGQADPDAVTAGLEPGGQADPDAAAAGLEPGGQSDPDAVITFPYTIADNDQLSATIERYDPDDPNGPLLKLRYVNRSPDQYLRFDSDSGIANGFSIDAASRYVIVGPGAEGEGTLQFPADKLAECGINYIEQIVFEWQCYPNPDAETIWLSAEPLMDAKLSLRLAEPGAEPATSAPVYTHGFASQVLVDNPLYCAAVPDYDPNGAFGPSFLLYLENRSESPAFFKFSEFVFNDEVAIPDDDIFSCFRYDEWEMAIDGSLLHTASSWGFLALDPGAKRYQLICLDANYLAKLGVSEIQKLTFRISTEADRLPAQRVTLTF